MSEKAKVYFSKEISPEKVLEMYQLLGKKLDGKVAIKLHSGEAGNQNFLKPEFWKPVIDYVGGTVVECNTAYEGERNTTAKHKKTLEAHGWSRYFKVDLLDAEGPDLEIAIPNGKVIQKNFVGKDLADYDSLLVLSHFKGHPMGGYGAQTAFDRHCIFRRQGIYSWCRKAGRYLDGRPRLFPGVYGGCGIFRCRLL